MWPNKQTDRPTKFCILIEIPITPIDLSGYGAGYKTVFKTIFELFLK